MNHVPPTALFWVKEVMNLLVRLILLSRHWEEALGG